jgi:mannose-1-phosphate guanylyltransferase
MLQDPEGRPESMLQRMWRQLQSVGLADRCIVATSANQSGMIVNQIGAHVPIIVEPERRDTFAAIALASAYLHSVQDASPDETIVVLPVDAYVEADFFQALLELEDGLSEMPANLVLMGVSPTGPSEKYGYILIESAVRSGKYMKVKGFHEKPSAAIAEQLIARSHAYWNCGVFAFRLHYMLARMQDRHVPLHYAQLSRQYDSLRKISFDYEIVEKEPRIAMLPYAGAWKDLGTWNALTEEMTESQIGMGTISEDSTNTHLINELNIPVTILGVPDSVVVVSPDGILVADKSASPRLKETLSYDLRPMFEEHSWGTSKVLDYSKHADGYEILTRQMVVKAGKQTDIEIHFERTEIWSVVSGTGEMYLDGKTMQIQKGFTCQIPPKSKHGVKAFTELYMLEIQSGVSLNADTINLVFTWGSAVV